MGWSIYEVICGQFEKIALYTPYYWRQYQVVGTQIIIHYKTAPFDQLCCHKLYSSSAQTKSCQVCSRSFHILTVPAQLGE